MGHDIQSAVDSLNSIFSESEIDNLLGGIVEVQNEQVPPAVVLTIARADYLASMEGR